MKNSIIFAIIFVLIFSQCAKDNTTEEILEVETHLPVKVMTISLEDANRLSELPLHCMQVEYPNKLNQVIGGGEDLQTPKELHPAFYGCFDWHSSVHGHWSLVSLLKQFPEIENRELIKVKLAENISEKNIINELNYFKGTHSKSFERTYGWAWLLKLAEELHTWDDPLARQLEQNLRPLTDHVVNGYLNFLPKLNYPIRVGEHTNTAFGLTFAFDYAIAVQDSTLINLITSRAKDFYLEDANCPISWEPSGFDFLSPCLEEADIMRRVLPEEEFKNWLYKFLPQLQSKDFNMETGRVSDRSDGKLVHLDGVNFSRAWCLLGIANQFPEYGHLREVANLHISYSLPSIVDDNYEGTHWLGSFAIYALNTSSDVQVD